MKRGGPEWVRGPRAAGRPRAGPLCCHVGISYLFHQTLKQLWCRIWSQVMSWCESVPAHVTLSSWRVTMNSLSSSFGSSWQKTPSVGGLAALWVISGVSYWPAVMRFLDFMTHRSQWVRVGDVSLKSSALPLVLGFFTPTAAEVSLITDKSSSLQMTLS